MTSAAIIVGIDDYRHQPLTSAVNDALAFRDKLIAFDLVRSADIRLFTAPQVPQAARPTKQNIANALYDLYLNGDNVDRFIFYYSGHGLLGFFDQARRQSCTTLMPVDFEVLERDGDLLINLDEVVASMRLVGPKEQLYFIDACRNLDYDHIPNVASLGWTGRPLGETRAQATLYAVAALGKALGVTGELGVMTLHLIEALEGAVTAVEYDQDADQYVVTMQSIRDHVQDAVGSRLKGVPMWQRKYQVPELDDPDPKTSAIRRLEKVDPSWLTLHIQPDVLADDAQVYLSQGRMPLAGFLWPPRQNHERVTLEPQRYVIRASCKSPGTAEPSRAVIDLRREHDATIRISGIALPSAATSRAPEAAIPEPTMFRAARELPGDLAEAEERFEVELVRAEPEPARSLENVSLPTAGATTGVISVRALEPQVRIELDALQPPYRHWEGHFLLHEEVSVGPYLVSFRLGLDVVDRAQVFVEVGQETEVPQRVAASALVEEAVIGSPVRPSVTQISETIGDIQAGVLETMLPILGIKPFDTNHEIAHRFDGLLPTLDPAGFEYRPLSVVIAVDGNGWEVPPRDVLRSVSCQIVRPLPQFLAPVALPSLTQPSRSAIWGVDADASLGLGRVGLVLAAAPRGPFMMEMQSPIFGVFRIASVGLPHRATVVTMTVCPDGSYDVSQNILRLPGRDDLYTAEPVSQVPYARMLRELQLGRKLFEGGELVSSRGGESWTPLWTPELGGLVYAKWTDPLLSCMAYFAWRDAALAGSRAAVEADDLMRQTAANLIAYFPELPDSRVIHSLTVGWDQDVVYRQMIERDEVPLLADAARILGQYAESHYRRDTLVAEVARRAPPRQIWSMIVE